MSDREFLEQAEDALHSIALDLIAVSPWLKKPFTDRPELTPWTRSTGRQARRAHDLAMTIRKHLGLPHRWRTSAFGSPPLEIEHVVASAVNGERERFRALAARWRQDAECDDGLEDEGREELLRCAAGLERLLDGDQ